MLLVVPSAYSLAGYSDWAILAGAFLSSYLRTNADEHLHLAICFINRLLGSVQIRHGFSNTAAEYPPHIGLRLDSMVRWSLKVNKTSNIWLGYTCFQNCLVCRLQGISTDSQWGTHKPRVSK